MTNKIHITMHHSIYSIIAHVRCISKRTIKEIYMKDQKDILLPVVVKAFETFNFMGLQITLFFHQLSQHNHIKELSRLIKKICIY